MGENKTPRFIRLTRKIVRAVHRHLSARAQAFSVLVIVLILLAAGVALFSHYATSPAEGVIDAVRNSLGGASDFDTTPQLLTGDYASFTYPKGLTAVASQPLAPPSLAVYIWKHPDIQTWRLAISIIDVPTYKMTDNNAYLFRKVNPQRFKEALQLINGRLVPIMTDTTAEGFSKIGFLKHGRYQAVISLYGDDRQGEKPLETTFSMVLHSWRWQ